MASIAKGDVEILVHTTAPSRASDDTRNRALAQAYLEFEPVERQILERDPIDDDYTQAANRLREGLSRSTQDERSSEASYRPQEGQESFPMSSISSQHLNVDRTNEGVDSPMLSFTDAIDNADSPLFRNYIMWRKGASREQSRAEYSQESWKQPPSTVADSQSGSERQAAFPSSPSRVSELSSKQSKNLTGYSLVSSSNDEDSSSRQSPQSSLRNSENHSSSSPVRKLTISWLLNEPGQASNVENRVTSTQDSLGAPKRIRFGFGGVEMERSSSAPTSLATTSSSSAQPPTRQRAEVDQVQDVETEAVTSSTTTELPISSLVDTTSIWAHKLEINPPLPVIYEYDLATESFITPRLHNLAMQMPLDTLYQPLIKERDPRPTERGYWLVNCKSWDTRLRNRCWEFLGNFTGSGFGGWAMRCVRDEQFEGLRIYCWGMVVGHVYLLLHTASESKVKKSNAAWIAGDGQAIIVMPS